MLGSGNARAQQCSMCRASSNRNDGFDHVISDEIVVNNKTDDDASIFEQKRDDFSIISHSCGIIPPPPLLLLLLLTLLIGRCYRHGRRVSSYTTGTAAVLPRLDRVDDDSLTTNDDVMINSGKTQNLTLYKVIHSTWAAECGRH